MKKAIVTGVLGQSGSYLAELLIEKGYKVVGLHRRTSNPNYENIQSVINHPNFSLAVGDITDAAFVRHLVLTNKPDEIYNLAAQSFVRSSFEQPFHTFEVDTLGVVNFLEVLRQEKLDIRFYQASTSEMFGKAYSYNTYDVEGKNDIVEYKYQNEYTKFIPQSPYGIAKLAAHHMVRLYRESYGVQGVCGILFNHESPRRGKEFVTRKITDYVGRLAHKNPRSEGLIKDPLAVMLNKQELTKFPKLALGNLDAYRDWGHAQDYVRAQYLILQQDTLEDLVICTGETHTVREFCKTAFNSIGCDYKDYVIIDPQFYRPAEVDFLRGDCTKAKTKLGWQPQYSFKNLVEEMVQADITRN